MKEGEKKKKVSRLIESVDDRAEWREIQQSQACRVPSMAASATTSVPGLGPQQQRCQISREKQASG
ncbi:Hypothetical protein SMAX5B_022317 [Scophthalmus maximus]|uniref:Uncharacterized protein n=1 Tax=Scophthalmus maximus TaxID=52904 RepID=A0A2U9C2Q3_SCOMX|nr:Hypothetical protein SMAX5B_022317 [Scophthalmus maximus]